MAERLLERAFTKAMASANAEQGRQERRPPPPRSEEEELRAAGAPMDAGDAIKRMLLAWKDKDYFRLLELPQPDVDELGRPAWSASAADVSRAYRRLSILVHPDKNPSPEARQAFEALNEAHRLLRDPGKREEVLKAGLDLARRRREAAEAAATLDERVVLNAQRKEKAKELQKAEAQGFQALVLAQARAKQEAAKRKRAARSRYRQEDSGDKSEKEEEGEEEEEASCAAQRARAKAKKKRNLIF